LKAFWKRSGAGGALEEIEGKTIAELCEKKDGGKNNVSLMERLLR